MNRLPRRPLARRAAIAVAIAVLMALAHLVATWARVDEVSLWFPPAAVSLVMLTYFGWGWAPWLTTVSVITVLTSIAPDADPVMVIASRSASVTAYTLGAEFLRSRSYGPQRFRMLWPLWTTALAAPALAAVANVAVTVIFRGPAAGDLVVEPLVVRALDIYIGDATGLFSLCPLLMTLPYRDHQLDRITRIWGYVALAVLAAFVTLMAITGFLPPWFLLALGVVPVAATQLSNLQTAVVIAAPAVLGNAVIATADVSPDRIRLAQAGLLALSLMVSAVHGLSRGMRHTRHVGVRREHRYAAVFESLSEGVLVLDSRARVIQINTSMTELFDLGTDQDAEGVLNFDTVKVVDRDGRRMGTDEILNALGTVIDDTEELLLGTDRPGADRIWVSLTVRLLPPSTDPTDARLVVTAADVTTRIVRESEEEATRAKLQHQALYDGLTGLPNRTLLMDRMSQANDNATRRGVFTGVLVIDLDGFKAVNDGLGHAAGDEVLVQVAVRLRSALRAADTAARLGGDEFVVLCEDLHPEKAADELELIIQRIHKRLDESYMTSAGPAGVGASIGRSLIGPDGDVDLDLMAQADRTMLKNKQHRKRQEDHAGDRARVDGTPRDQDDHGAADADPDDVVTVIIVEDDSAMRLLATRIIESSHEGVHVVGQASDGAMATSLIVRTRPDVVLCDVRMAGLSGPEVVHTVRAQIPDQRFVFWSAIPLRELQQHRAAMGVGVLSKDRIEDLPRSLREFAADREVSRS